MRSHAKAPTAGSTKRLGTKSRPALLACVLAAAVAVLALVVGSASGATTRFLVEVFGSSAQPTFPGDRGMAVDQASGELYVLESSADEIRRYNSDGTPSNFGALGSNAIDGEGAEDETPEGSLDFPSSRTESQIAIDESGGETDGNIYVTERGRDQVSIFSSEGVYLGELNAFETGSFNEPLGVAVDPSGNVYVGDFSSADLVHKYEPAANPPVNADNVASFATLAGTSSPGTLAAGVGSTAGFIFVNRFNGELFKLDDTSGEIKYQITTSASTVRVDPESGHVFVPRLTGENSEVVEYDASGGAEATKVSAFKPGSTVEGVATDDSAERVYVSRSGTENVEVFGPALVAPDVVTSPVASNTGTRATLAGTVNPDGVELDECFFEWGQRVSGNPVYGNTVPCAETPAEIGAGTSPVAVHADISGLKPHGVEAPFDSPGRYEYRLVAKNPNATINGADQDFNTPKTVFTEAASGITPTAATLNGSVNPDTATISECVFEAGPVKAPGEEIQKYPETLPCVPGPGAITGESPVAVEADLTGLHPGTTYHYRLKATYPTGPELGEDTTVQTSGPRIVASWAQDVIFTEAILKAEIDPEGKATTYRFEYGVSEAYGSETPELAVGSDSSVHELTRFLEGLEEDTTYHFRLIATNADAENVGPDQTFATYERFVPETDCPNRENRYGAGANLPDCRAYELVSPLEKGGRGIVAGPNTTAGEGRSSFDQASVNGDKITYTSASSFGDALGNRNSNQYLAGRGAGGWNTHSISAYSPDTVLAGVSLANATAWDTPFFAFSDDLSSAWLLDYTDPPLRPDGVKGFANAYRRDNLTDTYHDTAITTEPLTSTTIIGYGAVYASGSGSHRIRAANEPRPGGHLIFEAGAQLTPDAPADLFTRKIYDAHDGELELVSVLPGGAASTESSWVGAKILDQSSGGGGGQVRFMLTRPDRGVSEDGSRVFWTMQGGNAPEGKIYARIDGETTVAVSESVTSLDAIFETADVDGATVVFSTEESDLYEFDVDSEEPTLIAHEVTAVPGAGEDLGYLYFVSRDVLDAGATEGEGNLYVRREGTNEFIATLAARDVVRNQGSATIDGGGAGAPALRVSRLTPDGAHFVFMSHAPLTGYDNTDAETGEAATEVFRYDAAAGELSCVSCNPSGARPDSAYMTSGGLTGTHPVGSPEETRTGPNFTSWRTAAWIPGWERELYAARVISDDGNRVFFNAVDALVPRDTNGRLDVYQWEAEGTGSCDEAGGCISLLTTGKSSAYSEFIDASADGSDVFVRTESSIHPDDPGLMDIYDAREGGGYPPPPPPPLPCLGDACQNVPEPPRDPTPASAGFRGAGDPAPRANCAAAARRAVKFSKRAKRLRGAAKRSDATRRSQRLRKRSARLARSAKRLSRNAKRCRRNNRRAQR
ncbi:MAG TPA: hypothetical protein VFT19_12770 [Solirubrobacterales bacterium]|nr:hypothetical protein [Solirubrobacterales bacterium]